LTDDTAARTWLDATDEELIILEKAMMLSGGKLGTCEALLRGERVPLEDLDPVYVAKYGLRS
jgi:hypothetical protein